MLVVEMFKAGDYAIGGIIGVMHAILVFRFVQVMNIGQWFKKKPAISQS